MTLTEFKELQLGDEAFRSYATCVDGDIGIFAFIVQSKNAKNSTIQFMNDKSNISHEYCHVSSAAAARYAANLLFNRARRILPTVNSAYVCSEFERYRRLLKSLHTRDRLIAADTYDDLVREFLEYLSVDPKKSKI